MTRHGKCSLNHMLYATQDICIKDDNEPVFDPCQIIEKRANYMLIVGKNNVRPLWYLTCL